MIDQDAEYLKTIFQSVIERFAELMGDPFGNYLTQKLIDVSTDDQLLQIVHTVQHSVFDLCVGMHGTRSV